MSAVSASSGVEVTIARHAGATVTAVALGLVASLPVAVSLQASPSVSEASIVGWQPLELGGALAIALVTVTVAALTGGFLGGLVREGHPVTGALVAMGVSWPIGITMVPLAAAVLGIQYRGAIFCIDTCTAILRSDAAGSGIGAYFQALVFGGATVVPLVLALFLWFGAGYSTRHGGPMTGVLLAVLGYGVLHAWSVLVGEGMVPFACLATGVIIWSRWLRARDEMGFPS